MSFPQAPVLQGQVVYEAHQGGFLDKVGSVLTSAGRILTSALPYLAEAASMYAPSLGNSSSQDLPNQTSYRIPTISRQELVRPRLLSEPKSAPIARQMLDKLDTQQARMQAPAPDWSGMQARSRQILDEIASSQGLPSYEQFHRQHNIAYDSQPRQSALGIERFVQPPSQSTGFINEDYGQIVRNLSHAQSYVPTDLHQARQKPPSHEKRFKAQAQQVPLRNDPLEEYLKEKKSHEQNMRQIRASMRTHGIDNLVRTNQKPKPMPDNYFLDPKTGNIDLTRIVQADRPPSDSQLKQILHRADMELYEARTEFEKLEAQKKLQQVKEILAVNMTGSNGLKNRDGYVIIGDQAYGQSEAIYKAIQDVEYFYAHGKHMPPLKYPTIPPENVNSKRHREIYPDVTQNYQKFLNGIVQETKAILKSEGKIVFDGVKPNFKKGVYGLFSRNFPNNGKWDTQVGHGFPGQIVLRDPKTGEVLAHPDSINYPGRVVTIDQYAHFKGQVVRAGYLSNYAFGYAAAAGRLHLDENANGLINLFSNEVGNTIAYGNLKSGQLVDNPKDTQAIKEGYEAYWREHPHEKRTQNRLEEYRSE